MLQTLHLVSMGEVESSQKVSSQTVSIQFQSWPALSEANLRSENALSMSVTPHSYYVFLPHVSCYAFGLQIFLCILNVCACPNQEEYDLNKER